MDAPDADLIPDRMTAGDFCRSGLKIQRLRPGKGFPT
jgi:hypothetical protein